VSSVLVIDDERQIRRLLRVSLESQGFAVHEAANGEDGLRALQGLKPDVVLLDLGLPDRDGAQVLAALRQWSSVPVIVLSVRNAEEDIVALLNAGADDYLTKPFNTGELIARLRVAIRHHAGGGPRAVRLGRLRWTCTSARSASPASRSSSPHRVRAGAPFRPTRRPDPDPRPHPARGLGTARRGGDQLPAGLYHGAAEEDRVWPQMPQLIVTEPGVGYRLRIMPAEPVEPAQQAERA
jgi:two-component system KDP operon response regulator KdpE